MRIVYDDTMQETMAAAVGEFMDSLNVGEMIRHEWGTDRVQMGAIKKKLGLYLEPYRMSIGNTVTHAYGMLQTVKAALPPADKALYRMCGFLYLQ